MYPPGLGLVMEDANTKWKDHDMESKMMSLVISQLIAK